MPEKPGRGSSSPPDRNQPQVGRASAKERRRIDVLVADPSADMDRSARSTDRLTPADALPRAYLHGGEKGQRDSNPVVAGDDDESTASDGASKAHDSIGGRTHDCPVRRGDVDAAVAGAVGPRRRPPRVGNDSSYRGGAQHRDGWIRWRWARSTRSTCSCRGPHDGCPGPPQLGGLGGLGGRSRGGTEPHPRQCEQDPHERAA